MASGDGKIPKDLTENQQITMKNQNTLQVFQKWNYGVIGPARQSSLDLTNPLQSIHDKREELEAKFQTHPEPHEPKWQEATLRTMTLRDSRSKVTQSYKATERIIANTRSIHDMLLEPEHPIASHLDQKARQEITFLVSLANDHYSKGYRNKVNDENISNKEMIGESSDTKDIRSKSEIKRELAIYLEIDTTLNQWEKFIKGEGEQPSLAKTLTLWLEQTNTHVETIKKRSEQERNFLTFYSLLASSKAIVTAFVPFASALEISAFPQSSGEKNIQTMWKRLNELQSGLDEARSAAKSRDLNAAIQYRKLMRDYEASYENYLKKIEDMATTDTTSGKSSIFRGEHYYEVFTPICPADGKYTQGDLFERMKSQKSFVTPTEQTAPVTSSSITKIPILGSVKHTIDEAKYAIINTTLPGHLLHPGAVERQIVQRGNEIGILTIGTGNGLLPKLNNYLAPYVWRGPDSIFKAALEEEKS